MTTLSFFLRRPVAQWPLLGLITFLGIGGCKKDGVDQYKRALVTFETGYASTNIDVAECALIQHRETLLRMQKSGYSGINYTHTLAIVNSRLSELYRVKGDRAETERFFKEATNYMNIQARAANRTGVEISPEQISSFVEHADKYVQTPWKTNR